MTISIVHQPCITFSTCTDTSQISCMPTKQWLQIEVDNEIVMHFLFSYPASISSRCLCLLKQLREVSIVVNIALFIILPILVIPV